MGYTSLSDVSIISACYFSGYSQIWGQTANRPTSRNARWGDRLNHTFAQAPLIILMVSINPEANTAYERNNQDRDLLLVDTKVKS